MGTSASPVPFKPSVTAMPKKSGSGAAGLPSVWCWVESMDDDAAFMALVLSNSQGELDPLEIGIHAFEAVPEGKRGRGNKGDGLKAYAEKIGRHAGLLSEYRQAGEIVKNIHLSESFLGKAKHLSAIHKLPREVWQTMAQWIVERQPSVATQIGRSSDASGEAKKEKQKPGPKPKESNSINFIETAPNSNGAVLRRLARDHD